MKKYFFDQVVEDSTSKFNKIKKEDYLSTGQYQIVDQGKEFVAGYTNDRELVNELSSPVIVFGDHTKVFKYIDFPLALGADGVKVLTVKNNLADSKYLYYYFKTLNLTDAGYSRHFKFLKEVNIPLPEKYDDQIHIAAVLTRAEKLIAKRKESIKALDEFLKSTFLEMFGDDFTKECKWELVEFGNVISTLTDYHANGSYEVLRDNVILKKEPDFALMVRTTDLEKNDFISDCNYIDEKTYHFLDKSKVYGGEIIINKIGSAGKVYLMPNLNRPTSLGMNAFLLRITSDMNVLFLYYILTSRYGKNSIDKHVKGAVTKTITKDAVRSILIPKPPVNLQNKFAAIVEKVESMKVKYNESLVEMEKLYGSLSQRAFRGEL